MKNKNELMGKLTKESKRLENKIEHRNIYNVRNFVITCLIKSGIAIDYALPFMLAGFISANIQISKGNTPFFIDEVTEKARIETIDTSSGIHLEHLSFDFNYDDELVEHSTGWKMNNNGLYERTVTSYRLNDEIDLTDTEKILSMSKEELENILVITNIKTISTNALTPEDEIYNSDAIIVINHAKSEEETITRSETTSENVWGTIEWVANTLLLGGIFSIINKLLLKTKVRDKLRECESSFRIIDKKELEDMKKILQIQKENLVMLDSSSKNIIEESDGYSYRLRRNIIEESEGYSYRLTRK